jgi:hypothetical protein
MPSNGTLSSVSIQAKLFTTWAVSSLIDGGFLVLWVIVQWSVSKTIETFPLKGPDQWVLSVFQILFSISTLVPVIVYIYIDVRLMLLQARRTIRDAEQA